MNKEEICLYINNAAIKSLLYEVGVSPKPGLVDKYNNGSHSDMDILTFIDSSIALNGYFYDCCRISLDNKDLPYDELFNLLRTRGIKADKDMLRATGNINTHKGAVFSLGLLASAAALTYFQNNSFDSEDILIEAGEICRHSFLKDFNMINPGRITNGEEIYLKYGIKGIRGEAVSGFPTIRNEALPFINSLEKENINFNDKCVMTLLKIMSVADDTNIISRGSIESLDYIKKKSKDILSMPLDSQIKLIFEFDKDLIDKNLSPGGSADLLAATLMIYFLKKY
ncbi:MAG: triphosphoribosyl-dephospho-CoA synthase CitG [Bacillota bacterium]|nr:triphosphoribosyl-dephospho-CoA synthase CitG [Bacillota bacterium]